MLRFIIREGDRQRYQGSYGPFPSVGSFWFSPTRIADFTIEVSDGVRTVKRPLRNEMVFVFEDAHEITFELDKKPNEKGMWNFKTSSKSLKKILSNEPTIEDRERKQIELENSLTDVPKPDSSNTITDSKPSPKDASESSGPKPRSSLKSKNID